MSLGHLIVFAKAPRAGLVKTRLAPTLDLEQAAALYDAMLQDVLAASARWAEELSLEAVLAFHPPDAVAELLRRTPRRFQLHVQRGAGLGERMANAFAESFAAGAPFALIRGSDSPTLTRRHLADAVDALTSGVDLVLTPDQGGGYAMIGARIPARSIFDVPMSTHEVLRKTIAEADSLGLRWVLTDPAHDVDRGEDLAALEASSLTEESDLCPRTVRSVLQLREMGVL